MLLAIAVLLAFRVVSPAENSEPQAWRILETGVVDKNPEVRAVAVGALGLVPQNSRAAALAEKALEDEKPAVRAAGARALGQMPESASIPLLRKALADRDGEVVMAAAHSLIQLKDVAGYEVYYSVLTGERKAGENLMSQEADFLKDPKKVAKFSLEQGIGLIPYGGCYALTAVEFAKKKKQDKYSAKAVAARVLANDPDPQSRKALIREVADTSWIVREAAIEAIAIRADPSLLGDVQAAMSDQDFHVRYTAAAVVISLTGVLSTDQNKN